MTITECIWNNNVYPGAILNYWPIIEIADLEEFVEKILLYSEARLLLLKKAL